MKAFTALSIAAAAAAFVTVSAQAQTSSQPLTRAQVQAELQRARASGELDAASAELYGPGLVQATRASQRNRGLSGEGSQAVQAAQVSLTRAQVQAELARARASGELDRSADELYGAGTNGTVPVKTRYAGSVNSAQ